MNALIDSFFGGGGLGGGGSGGHNRRNNGFPSPASMDEFFETMVGGFRGGDVPRQGNGGPPPFFAGMLHRMMNGSGGMPNSYEDWLSFTDERMGGGVSRGATEQEIAGLGSEVYSAPKRRSSSEAGSSSSSAAKRDDDDVQKCAICLGEFEEGLELTRLPCTHVFCKPCIAQWLAINKECPCCKASIRDASGS